MFGEIISQHLAEIVVLPLVRERAECQTPGSGMAHGCERAECYCHALAWEIVRAIEVDQTPLGAEFEKVWDDNVDKLYEPT